MFGGELEVVIFVEFVIEEIRGKVNINSIASMTNQFNDSRATVRVNIT